MLRGSSFKDFNDARQLLDACVEPAMNGGIQDYQLSRFKSVWHECRRDVIYYRNLVDSGFAPAEISSWEDVHAIPLLTRRILQERSSEFRRICSRPDEFRMTGGSTGEPIRLGVWKRELQPQKLAKLALWQRCGYEQGDRLFLIWGHLHLLGSGIRKYLNHGIRKIKDRILGYKRVNAYSLSPEKCDKIARALIQFKPRGLVGYSSALDYFVRQTTRYHNQFAQLGLKFVMPAAEMAPHSDTFALLKSVFQCPVVQEFGGVEFGQVAMKYGDEPFRVFHDLNYVETVNLSGHTDDQDCCVVTSLNERYIPLIRYVQGDRLESAQKLPNGHVHSFGSLRGRVNDVVSLKDGSVVHSVGILHCIHQETSVINVQLVLRDCGATVHLVVNHGYDEKVESTIRARLNRISPILGDAPIELVTDLQTTRAGKRRWLIDQRTENSAE
jgi:phenylacetate-coenzyme A ligase PaaK-like adenylate-forming protein